ncbi:MAG: phosphoglycerate kinase [bacterium]|nr:phosphoglycerate kinase [bacterium]
MNLKNKRIILRVDFNFPFEYRVQCTLPTIKTLLKKGAKVVLITHAEQGGRNPSLSALYEHLKIYFPRIILVKGKIFEMPADFFQKSKTNIALLDNLRLQKGEKENNLVFARILASWGDYYINDAFAASHREHASIISLPKYLPHEAGPLLKKEVAELSRVFKPGHPFLFILAGKKFGTKEPLVSRFLKSTDAIFIGGALGNTFLELRGIPVGASKTENIKIPDKILWNSKILLPEDAIVYRSGKKKTVLLNEIEKNDLIYDAGPKTLKVLSGLAKNAKFVLLNGTLGFCEKGFSFGTRKLAQELGKSKAYKLVGGGDTVAAIRKMKLEKNFDFISTGGGAMLEFLAKGTLPGIAALGEPRLQSRREALKKK